MSYLINPPNYKSILNLQQTELGIQKIKDFFQANLSAELRLRRVTANEDGFLGLNGDILLWNPMLNVPFEISSMGIRVDKNSLEKQLQIEDKEDRKELYFHKRLLNNELPLTIGGGIGQSRLCMFLLQKAHIGEIQASIWPEEMREKCKAHNIPLI